MITKHIKPLNKSRETGNIEFSPKLGKRTFRNARYDTSDFITLRQIITKEYMKEFELSTKVRKEFNKHQPSYEGAANSARNMLCKFINVIVENAIENNYTFKLPDIEHCYIGIASKSSAQIQDILSPKCKVYQDVDLINTDFKIYQFFYRATNYIRQCRINHHKYKRIVKSANEGRIYNPLINKTLNDYIEPFYKEYTMLSEKQIKKILTHGLSSIGRLVNEGKNIFIKNVVLDTYLVIYTNDIEEEINKGLIF